MCRTESKLTYDVRIHFIIPKSITLVSLQLLESNYGITSHSLKDLEETLNPSGNSGSDILFIPSLIE